MITLYHHPRTRSSRFIFLLEELGCPYEIHRIARLRHPDGSGGVDPENPHPHGKSPALKDGDTLVFESTAIALYLTDRFPQNGLGPVVGDAKRGAYVSWLAYYAGVMEPAWMSAYMKWEIPRGTAGWVATDAVMDLHQRHAGQGTVYTGRDIQRRGHPDRHHLQDVHGLAHAGNADAGAGSLCEAGDRPARLCPRPGQREWLRSSI